MESYEAVNDYTEDVTVENETVSSTGTDENAIHVSQGASAILKGISVDRESEDSKGGDTSSFYGVGAAILATEGNAYVGKVPLLRMRQVQQESLPTGKELCIRQTQPLSRRKIPQVASMRQEAELFMPGI